VTTAYCGVALVRNTAVCCLHKCSDELYGTSVAIILNPVSTEVTHLVVREPGLVGSALTTNDCYSSLEVHTEL
jgi:hypothetical protein